MTVRVDLDWDGPYKLSQLASISDVSKDYGIYQIYGHHPIYGPNVLLYVGLASRQTFGTRIAQEGWEQNKDSKNVEVYVGRLCGASTPSDDEWDRLIKLTEKLLIFSHTPAANQSNIGSIPFAALEELHIFNWGNHRSLSAEVSGLRWCTDTELRHFIYVGEESL
ncbi:hypothetical protein [Cohnella zeiphila]|uniref:GIY-YIG domain-containing protein n=1 Tax=Cohnella zeiphila TaxID=2761120 RepID=A0A7X0SMG8_9BACL|nr:hypothetical protein [Cohnella zeiphila]MBB6732695.1 hypothetical protein [Cohnella zeiphila]